jgi:hypothetical protein
MHTPAEVQQLLEASCSQLEEGFVQVGMSTLFAGLHKFRLGLPHDEWEGVIEQTRRHRLFGLVMQDPITRRCFDKPRGYPGDAVLLDLIYKWPTVEDLVVSASEVGRAIYGFTNTSSTAQSVRDRRSTIATLIDRCAATSPGARVLSVAAGHLREGVDSVAFREGQLAELVALDQDTESVAEVGRGFDRTVVTPICSSLRPLLTGCHGLGEFDLIYSAGLYDYLAIDTAVRLTARLFGMLRPGGRLWVANFLPGIAAVGYMEACMDWHLLYRPVNEIQEFAREIPESDLSSCSMQIDRHNHIGSLELVRRENGAGKGP